MTVSRSSGDRTINLNNVGTVLRRETKQLNELVRASGDDPALDLDSLVYLTEARDVLRGIQDLFAGRKVTCLNELVERLQELPASDREYGVVVSKEMRESCDTQVAHSILEVVARWGEGSESLAKPLAEFTDNVRELLESRGKELSELINRVDPQSKKEGNARGREVAGRGR